VGLLTFGESLAVIGVLIPATAVLLAVGGFMGANIVEPLPILFWAIGGAFLGDWASYAFGRRIGPGDYRAWPLNRNRLPWRVRVSSFAATALQRCSSAAFWGR
jgi:membrane protein DedA with SNARE-associated domain